MRLRFLIVACALALTAIAVRTPMAVNMRDLAALHAAAPSSGRAALQRPGSGGTTVRDLGRGAANDPAALTLRGDAEWQLGRVDRARASWTAAGDFRRLVEAGSYLAGQRKWDSAEAMYFATAKIPSSGATGLLDAAALRWNREDKKSAISIYEWLVLYRPADGGPLAFANLATLYAERGEFARADSAIRRGLARWPRSVLLRTAEGVTYAKSGRTRQADATLTQVWSEDRKATDACIWLALTKEQEGDDGAAAAQFRDCLSVNPANAQWHYQYGLVLARLKRPAEARQQFLLAAAFPAARDRLREMDVPSR